MRKVFGTYTCDAALLGHLDYDTNHDLSWLSLSIVCNAGTNLHICSLVWKKAGLRQGDCDLSSISGRPLDMPSSGGGEMQKPAPCPLLLVGPTQRTQGSGSGATATEQVSTSGSTRPSPATHLLCSCSTSQHCCGSSSWSQHGIQRAHRHQRQDKVCQDTERCERQNAVTCA